MLESVRKYAVVNLSKAAERSQSVRRETLPESSARRMSVRRFQNYYVSFSSGSKNKEIDGTEGVALVNRWSLEMILPDAVEFYSVSSQLMKTAGSSKASQSLSPRPQAQMTSSSVPYFECFAILGQSQHLKHLDVFGQPQHL